MFNTEYSTSFATGALGILVDIILLDIILWQGIPLELILYS
jgi:hypothetical protein